MSKWFKSCIHYFKSLNQLQLDIFNCYLKKDYPQNKIFYEQKIHKARVNLFLAMKKIRALVNQKTTAQLAKLESLYEIIFSLNTLKLRVSDQSTFEVCETEFALISNELSKTIAEIILMLNDPVNMLNEMAVSIGNLSHCIDLFQELYRSTLQVVSKEPIFFLFFVQGLIDFRDELELFLRALNEYSIEK